MAKSTAVVCTECGKGNFLQVPSWPNLFGCTTQGCDTEVTWDDILPNLDSEQDAYVFLGVMRVTVPEGW